MFVDFWRVTGSEKTYYLEIKVTDFFVCHHVDKVPFFRLFSKFYKKKLQDVQLETGEQLLRKVFESSSFFGQNGNSVNTFFFFTKLLHLFKNGVT